MKHEELTLEKQCRSHARACGWACWKNEKNGCKGIPVFEETYLTPLDAFVSIINGVSGIGIWQINPLVWVYEFELVN